MLQKKYISQPAAIASYNYTDLADNTGITLFYTAAKSGGNLSTQNQIYSSSIEETAGTVSGSYVSVIDKDYDLSAFNAPKVIRGAAVFNYTIGVDSTADAIMEVRVRKYDGTTETEISAASGSALIHNGSSAQTKTEALVLTIPQTPFKKGEILRITANLYGRGNNTGSVYYGVDPMNRDGVIIIPSADENTTQFKCWIPFDLDL